MSTHGFNEGNSDTFIHIKKCLTCTYPTHELYIFVVEFPRKLLTFEKQ